MTHKNAKYFSDEDYYYMVKDEITTTKYLIHSQINAKGFVEKPDVVGAIFGQTEGLLSDSLDLRELQKTGRIGRIKVDMTNKAGRTKGEVIIPSSLDRVETTIVAASLETINRVGPCEASLRVTKIEDVRAVKRRTIVERAKELYQNMMEDFTPESSRMIEEVKESIRIPEIVEFGEDKLPAGPNTAESDAILIVEGRSDVLNLLKYGIKNTIAVEGVNIPKTVIDLTKDKTVTAFLDGDRGGDLILKELLQVGNIDYVTRAPRGQEVEYLNKDDVIYALKNKTSVDKIKSQANYNHNNYRYNKHHNQNDDNTKVYDMKKPVTEYKTENYPFKKNHKKDENTTQITEHKNNNNHHHHKQADIHIKHDKKEYTKDTKENTKTKQNNNQDHTKTKQKKHKLNKYQKILNQLTNTNKGKLYNEDFNLLKEVPVEQIYNEIKITDDVKTVIFDGIISQRLVDLAKEKNIEQLAAVKMSEVVKKPETIKIIIKQKS